jgi:RNase H-fold protein (predicted Holliday junction resolvase)
MSIRTITMRQFARNLKEELKNLPVCVTLWDEPLFVVISWDKWKNGD